MEKEQIRTVHNNSFEWKWPETTNIWVEVINSKRQITEKAGHVVQIHIWLPFGENVIL